MTEFDDHTKDVLECIEIVLLSGGIEMARNTVVPPMGEQYKERLLSGLEDEFQEEWKEELAQSDELPDVPWDELTFSQARQYYEQLGYDTWLDGDPDVDNPEQIKNAVEDKLKQ